jgi:hypothetical protein
MASRSKAAFDPRPPPPPMPVWDENSLARLDEVLQALAMDRYTGRATGRPW